MTWSMPICAFIAFAAVTGPVKGTRSNWTNEIQAQISVGIFEKKKNL